MQHIHYPEDSENKLKEFVPGNNRFSTFNSSRYKHSLGDKIDIESSEDDPHNFKTKIKIDGKDKNSVSSSYTVKGASTNDLVYGQVHKYTNLTKQNSLDAGYGASQGSGYIQSINSGDKIKYDFNKNQWKNEVVGQDGVTRTKYVYDNVSQDNIETNKCNENAKDSLAGLSEFSHLNAPGWDLYEIDKYNSFNSDEQPDYPTCYYNGNGDKNLFDYLSEQNSSSFGGTTGGI
tara:strand:- start:120 stop:815 length:696 start_codon:yes stop_codon:yes gene_type:complete